MNALKLMLPGVKFAGGCGSNGGCGGGCGPKKEEGCAPKKPAEDTFSCSSKGGCGGGCSSKKEVTILPAPEKKTLGQKIKDFFRSLIK